MQIEYEKRFIVGDLDALLRSLIEEHGCIFDSEFFQTRAIYKDKPDAKEWFRLRREKEATTFTYKSVEGDEVREIQIEVSSYDDMLLILKQMGHEPKTTHENYRRLLTFTHKNLKAPITLALDTWPEIGHILEIEGGSEEDIEVAKLLLGLLLFQELPSIWDIYEERGKSILERSICFSEEEREALGTSSKV